MRRPRQRSSTTSTRSEFKAIGITCGVGSMLVGARNAGFKVAGNVEWRKYYHAEDEGGRNTFTANFDDAVFPYQREQMTEEEFLRFQNADIALGHPECGNFSQLNANREAVNDPGDIPLFADLVAEFKPRFFVMDDLPKSFIAFPMSEYHARLPDYDLFPEWVSNWGYGNTQKARNRFFMLGSLKTEKWAFVPGEGRHDKRVSDIIGDLEGMEGNFPNHDRHVQEERCAKGLHLKYHGHRATWREMQDYILGDVKEGGPIHYHGPDGREMIRVGSYKGHWHGPAHVLTGGISGFHPLRGTPYTIRERARLQGFPDDFAFYGTVYSDEDGQRRWNHDRNMHMVRQTGKAMPIQFCEYVSRQIMDHCQGRGLVPYPNNRVLPPNEHVSAAKRWYCANVGYADQNRACRSCWMAHRCEIREGQLGLPPIQGALTDGLPTRSLDRRRTVRSPSLRAAADEGIIQEGVTPGETPVTPPISGKSLKSLRNLGSLSYNTTGRPAKSKAAGEARVVPTQMLEFD